MADSIEETLWLACAAGDMETVKSILEQHPLANVNWVGPEKGDAPLHRACRFGHIEIVKELMRHPEIKVNQGNTGNGGPFYLACQEGFVKIVRWLLADPRIDPTMTQKELATPFYIACQEGRHEVVSLLLGDPRIDPNQADVDEATPFNSACERGHDTVVSLLLEDPRLDVNKPMESQAAPILFAAQNGNLSIVQRMLASAKEIDTKRVSTLTDSAAAEHARLMVHFPKQNYETEEDLKRRQQHNMVIANMIEEYERDPITVRHRLRQTRGIREHFIGHTFALVVFFSDGFATATKATPPPVARFFEICVRLPLDLQMVLCNRAFGSSREIVSFRDSEPGFKCLLRSVTWGNARLVIT